MQFIYENVIAKWHTVKNAQSEDLQILSEVICFTSSIDVHHSVQT
jgi:hypothetical protein